MRAASIALATLGGIGSVVFAYANVGAYLSGTAAQAILIPLAGLIGALPGLILLWLTTPRRG